MLLGSMSDVTRRTALSCQIDIYIRSQLNIDSQLRLSTNVRAERELGHLSLMKQCALVQPVAGASLRHNFFTVILI